MSPRKGKGRGEGKKRKESKETRRRHKREAENCPTHQEYKERSKVARVARKDARRIVAAEKKRASAFEGRSWVVKPDKYRWMNEKYREYYSKHLMEAVDDMRMEDERRTQPDIVDLTHDVSNLHISQKPPKQEKDSVSAVEDPDVDWMMKHDIEGGFDWSEGYDASPDDGKVQVPEEWGVVTADEVFSTDIFDAKNSATDNGAEQGLGGASFSLTTSSEAEVRRLIGTSGEELGVGEESLNHSAGLVREAVGDFGGEELSGIEALSSGSSPPDDKEEGVGSAPSQSSSDPALLEAPMGDDPGVAALSSESSPPDNKEEGVGSAPSQTEGVGSVPSQSEGVGSAPSQSFSDPALLEASMEAPMEDDPAPSDSPINEVADPALLEAPMEAPMEDDPAPSDSSINEVAEFEGAFRDGGADINEGFTLPDELHAFWVQKVDLSDDEQSLVKKHFRTRGKADKILIEGMGDMGYNTIQLGSFKRLRSPWWINDEVINYWLKLLQKRDTNLCNANPGRKATLFLNTHFVKMLFRLGDDNPSLQGRYFFGDNMKRWVKKAARKVTQDGDLLSLKRIFFPVHLGFHWAAAVIDIEQKAIVWYDSMGSTDTYKLKGLLRLLCDVCKDSHGNSCIVETDWSLVPCNTEEVPQQWNGKYTYSSCCPFLSSMTQLYSIFLSVIRV